MCKTQYSVHMKYRAPALPPPSLPVLLDEPSAQALAALLAEGQSANTLRSYQAALRYWAEWFVLRYGDGISLPVAPSTVLQFIVDHVAHRSGETLRHELPEELDEQLVRSGHKRNLGALSLATVNHRISVLSQAHRLSNLENPCETPAVRHLLASTRRAYASRGVRSRKKPAITATPLLQMLATCDDSLRGLRDRALLLFAVATGGRRRSEIVSASLDRLRGMGPAQFVYVMGQSKADQLAQEDPYSAKPIVGAAAVALANWLAASGLREGAIFRRIWGAHRIGGPLCDKAVSTIVQTRARAAGLSEDYSAHSLRAGFMTEAGRQNVPLGEAMALSGHASLQVALGYFRAGNVLSSEAARLFDSEPEPANDPEALRPRS